MNIRFTTVIDRKRYSLKKIKVNKKKKINIIIKITLLIFKKFSNIFLSQQIDVDLCDVIIIFCQQKNTIVCVLLVVMTGTIDFASNADNCSFAQM